MMGGIYVLLGPPGSGKGTQAERLRDRLGMAHLSSGDILRAERASGSELGREVARYIDAGQLVPDETIIAVILGRLKAEDCERDVVLDGFPRTVPQAEALDRALTETSRAVAGAVLVEVPDEEVVRRISGRRTCPACHRVYHVEHNPPRQPGRCDEDGTELVQRPDDREDVIRRRLEAYHEQTRPLVDYYARKGLLRRVDGVGDVEAVWQRLEAAIARAG